MSKHPRNYQRGRRNHPNERSYGSQYKARGSTPKVLQHGYESWRSRPNYPSHPNQYFCDDFYEDCYNEGIQEPYQQFYEHDTRRNQNYNSKQNFNQFQTFHFNSGYNDEYNHHYNERHINDHYNIAGCNNHMPQRGHKNRNIGVSHKGKGKSKIPDRWGDYSKVGLKVGNTPLVPMKVPLKENLLQKIEPDNKFSCNNAIEIINKDEANNLAMVINLCNTNRYYNEEEFTSNGIEYKKIDVPGHIIPNKKIVDQFVKIVSDFEDANAKTNKVVAVHCTHGLNRTGYMICRYLIEKNKLPPKIAVKIFNEARGHTMERDNYIQDLMSRT